MAIPGAIGRFLQGGSSFQIKPSNFGGLDDNKKRKPPTINLARQPINTPQLKSGTVQNPQLQPGVRIPVRKVNNLVGPTLPTKSTALPSTTLKTQDIIAGAVRAAQISPNLTSTPTNSGGLIGGFFGPIFKGIARTVKDVIHIPKDIVNIYNETQNWEKQKKLVESKLNEALAIKRQLGGRKVPDLEKAISQLSEFNTQLDKAKITPGSIIKGLGEGLVEQVKSPLGSDREVLAKAKEYGLGDVKNPQEARNLLGAYLGAGLFTTRGGKGGLLRKSAGELSKLSLIKDVAPKVDDVLRRLNVELNKKELNTLSKRIATETDEGEIGRILTNVQQSKKLPGRTRGGIRRSSTAQEVNDILNAAAESAKNRYSKPSLFRRAEQGVNPFAYLSRIDQKEAARRGVNVGDYAGLPATDRLEHLADISNNPASIARQADLHLQGFGIDKVIQKYGEGTVEGKQFRNYQNAKFAQEVAKKRGLKILPDEEGNKLSVNSLGRFVKEYEARNPDAAIDNLKFKQAQDAWLDKAIDAGLIQKADADYVKNVYKYYVPIHRLFPDELERASVNAAPIGSVGRQSVIQSLEGSAIPVDNSFNAFIDRARKIQRQINRNKFFNVYRQRVEGGAAPGVVRQSADQMRTLKALKAQLTDVSKLEKQVKGLRNVTARKTAGARLKVKASTRDAANKARALLRDSVVDDDARAVISQLADDELVDIYKNIAESGEKGTIGLQRLLSKRGAAYDSLRGQLEQLRTMISDVRSEKGELRQGIFGLSTDPTTGQQIINGFQDGLPVKIEVPPEAAKIIQGLDQEKLNLVLRVIGGIEKPFRAAFTGLLNPLFTAISFVFYDPPMGFLNSPNGWRTVVSPKAIGEMFKSLSSKSDFQKRLGESGAMLQTGSLTPSNIENSAKYIAAQKNLFSRLKYNVNPKNIKEVANRLDVLGGKLTNATRSRIAKVTYDDAIRKGLTPEQAMANATYMFNNAMPNFNRTSGLLRQIDQVFLYTAASVAGTRSAGIALRRAPVKTLTKAAVLVAPMSMVVAHNLSSEKAEEYYKTLIDEKKEYILDNNMVIVLPNAERDPKTGEWSGIIKIPLPPEFRSINKLVWRQTRDIINGNGLSSPQAYARAAFDTATGQVFTGADNPAFEVAAGLVTGTNPKTGGDIVYEGSGKTPTRMKLEYVLNQFGIAGRVATGSNPLEEVAKRFTGTKTLSEGQKFFRNRDEVAQTIHSQDEKSFFLGLTGKNENKGFLDSQVRATKMLDSMLSNKELYNAFKALDTRQRAEGKPGNPFYDLSEEQQKKILTYQTGKLYRQVGQNRDKNEEADFKALGLEKRWYDDYRNAETIYYKKLGIEGKDSKKTLSGKPALEMPKDLEKFEDYYFKLPYGTGQRTVAGNTELGKRYFAFLDKKLNFTNSERKALGLTPIKKKAYGGGDVNGHSGYSRGGIPLRGGRGRGGKGRGIGPVQDIDYLINNRKAPAVRQLPQAPRGTRVRIPGPPPRPTVRISLFGSGRPTFGD